MFGLNSGFEEVSGRGSMAEEGSVLFFTAMNERLGGAKAAQQFTIEVIGISNGENNLHLSNTTASGEETVDVDGHAVIVDDVQQIVTDVEDDTQNATNPTLPTNATRYLLTEKYPHAIFISPLGETNSAYQLRHDGFRDELLAISNHTGATIDVEWFEVDASSLSGLTEKIYGCKYQRILVGSGKLTPQVVDAVEANGCHLLDIPTKTGTFDASTTNFNMMSEQRLDFIIDQHNHMQGWSPVHFAALFVSTGLVLAPPPDGVYLSGPAVFTKANAITDTLRICTDEAFPVCPNTNGPDGLPSDCQCTNRKKIIIGGVANFGIQSSRQLNRVQMIWELP